MKRNGISSLLTLSRALSTCGAREPAKGAMLNARRVSQALFALVLTSLAACGLQGTGPALTEGQPDGAPRVSRGKRAPVQDASAPPTERPSVAEAGVLSTNPRPPDAATQPDARVPQEFAAQILRTNPTKFGGAPYCFYVVNMTDVVSWIEFDPFGNVTRAEVRSTMDETLFDQCSYPPLGKHKLHFQLASASPQGGDLKLEYQGAADNVIPMTLTFRGRRTAASIEGTFSWHRTYENPLLAWTVTAATVHAPAP